jgi:kynurenine formamidase
MWDTRRVRRGGFILALVIAVAVAATAFAAERALDTQQSPGAARLSSLPSGRIAKLVQRTGIAATYWAVDPRTARPLRLGQPLTTAAPLFPGDPPFHWRVWTTVPESGYLLEQFTSLGTHTGTHISAPCHFHVGAPCLVNLPEKFFTPRPLVVLDLRSQIRLRHGNGDFFVGIHDLKRFERAHDRIPPGSYVVLYTGLSRFYHLGNHRRPGAYNDYFDDVPGFSGAAVEWLFQQRHILGVGADTFGPDATFDLNFEATTEATGQGGITLENMGQGLGDMRAFGDWIELNGPRYATTSAQRRAGRPGFSGAHMGMTGFTVWR